MAMIKKLVLCLGVLGAAVAGAADLYQGSDAGIGIMQNGRQVGMSVESGNIHRVVLSKQPFDISYPEGVLNLCAWTDDSIFTKAKRGTDTMQDFSSCMFIYKSVAMRADASYLFLSEESGFSLNPAHGAKKLSAKRASYHVTHLEREGKDTPAIQLTDVAQTIYLVAWMDKDKNQVINDGELEHFVLEFK